jgi:hypothetical protein
MERSSQLKEYIDDRDDELAGYHSDIHFRRRARGFWWLCHLHDFGGKMMRSNIPTFAVHQDYQARHSDMLAAARGEGVQIRSGILEIWRGREVWISRPPTEIRWIGRDLASSWEISQG